MIYYGSGDEVATKRIRPAYESILLKPRILRDLSSGIDTSTTVLGSGVSVPVMPSAPGLKFFVSGDGELQTARAASAVGTTMLIPHISTYNDSLDAFVDAAPDGNRWFQLYVLRDRRATREAIERAEAAGCTAIVLTVSSPAGSNSIRRRSFGTGKINAASDIRLTIHRQQQFPGVVSAGPDFVIENSISWPIIDWIRSVTTLPLIIKGIVNPYDAKHAVESGAAGVIVSTHASRLFDGAVTPIEALPAVADAVAEHCEVYLDGGVRTGADIFKALALGARACLIGKPLYYGLAVAGEDGVKHIFSILKRELELAMKVCGVTTVNGIDRSFVTIPELKTL
jgi:4-hydroxymandelate oxidase